MSEQAPATGNPVSPHASAPAPASKHVVITKRHATIVIVLVLIAVALCIYVPRIFIVSTDDAYVEADTVTVVPKVPAYVTALHVSDNTVFSKGQLLVELDPRDYQVALDNAAANLASANAYKLNISAQIDEQRHQVVAAQAALDGDRATLVFANQQLIRYNTLSHSGSDTKERLQQATSEVGQQSATVAHDTAMLAAAKAHIMVLESQVVQVDASITAKQAELDQARLNLSYTHIYATMDGTVANRSVQAGNYVQPGQSLFSAVPREVFVIANIKETQLGRVRPGQAAVIRVDALPGLMFRGHIDSIQRGTGANFALLPPENATGNFIKVVQRVPIKIVLDPSRDAAALSPGMSVIARVVVRKPPWGLESLVN